MNNILTNWNNNLTVVSALVFYTLWNYNNGIWPLFFEALAGSKVIEGSRMASSSFKPGTGVAQPKGAKTPIIVHGRVQNPAQNFGFGSQTPGKYGNL